jgi:hypothetical protein
LECHTDATRFVPVEKSRDLRRIKIFRPTSLHVHSLDTEWPLSTLFDASLFMTGGRLEVAAPFLLLTQVALIARRKPSREDFSIRAWTGTPCRGMLLPL